MSLLRRYSAPAALAAVLFASIAAPYLTPIDPDAAVFRSGSLGALLLLGCYLPVRGAYIKANRRTLLCGMVWGFLFACALGLGSELAFYGRLLPGAGSMIRRLAVPVLITPLAGGLCARMMLGRLPRGAQPARLPMIAYAAVFFVCWLPLLLAYYPGMLNYDIVTEYGQHLAGRYSNIHPLLHSALMNGVISIGERMNDPTLGVLFMSLLQMIFFALSLGHACAFAQRRGAPRWALAALAALFALHPVFSVMSLSMTKDTLFAAAILTLSLEIFELLRDPDSFLSSKARCLLFVILTIGAALMRNNGVFALALMFPAVLIAAKGRRLKTAALLGAGVCAALLTLFGLHALLKPSAMPSFQLYSLPAQQLVRVYNSGKLTDEERAEIEQWYTSEDGLVLHPHLADPAKGYLDKARLESDGGDFLAIWKKHFPTYTTEYIEAFLLLNIGSWYPDDRSHQTIYPDVSWNDKGYLQTQEYDLSAEGIISRCFLPDVRDFYEQICRRNEYKKYPVISLLFCTATPLWVLLFAALLLIARGHTRFLPAALGALGLWASYLFGPCTLPRYTLPLFALAPVLLIAALCLPDVPGLKRMRR